MRAIESESHTPCLEALELAWSILNQRNVFESLSIKLTDHAHTRSTLTSWLSLLSCSPSFLGDQTSVWIRAHLISSDWLCTLSVTLSLPRVTHFQISPAASQEYNIAQYEELGFSHLPQIKDDYTTNSHYFTYTFLSSWLGEWTFWTWEWKVSKFEHLLHVLISRNVMGCRTVKAGYAPQ